QAQDGTTWRYETDEIMNLMPEVKLSVYQDDMRYAPLVLSKIETDTFSDGNLTVYLTQVGEKKSIAVDHQSISLKARAENGWCSERILEQAIDDQPSDSWSIDESTTGEFRLQVSDRCANPCSFSVKSDSQVTKVVYEVEGWVIAESENAQSDFAVSYTFNTLGRRSISAVGFDRNGNQVSSDSRFFELTGTDRAEESSQGQNAQLGPINVPYYYQYSNGLYPSSSCQNTAIAMVLSYLGANVNPDAVTREFGKDQAQSVGGLNYVFNTLARRFGVKEISSYENGSLTQLKESLDQGNPVIVHGFFTSYGHVLVVTGYDEGGYYVNDPAGTWSRVFKGGYPNAWNETTEGKNIYYSKDAFERAVATYDGYSFTSLYLHVIR
ncbi:MAG: hypothetical protein CMH49_02035, partial [Myxococcales bacterium]|nr:hypothetical protein [Myxococcales bacterium]